MAPPAMTLNDDPILDQLNPGKAQAARSVGESDGNGCDDDEDVDA